MARLWSGDASEADTAACAAWRAAHPEHERAWARLQRFEQRFDTIPREVARGALSGAPRDRDRGRDRNQDQDRRRVLQVLGIVASGGGAALLAHETGFWQRTTADYSTAVGETRAIVLADGSRVVLDTASAIDVLHGASERRIVLRAGAILVESAPDKAASHRPLLVQTAQGTATALGTRFMVRSFENVSEVAVFEGMVELRPLHEAAAAVRLPAGMRGSYSRHAAQANDKADDSAAAWTQGSLVAERMRLADLLGELARYRHGVLRCDERVAGLRVTGVYSLRDIDRSLANLALSLPVELAYRTRFWVTVRPRRVASTL
ncbi:hypothetical protein CD932_17485 [Janthinobacterium sp. PC23-8]|nr:hypothetical protein CD932_17485 [Janthinobacterium sp. PC23-8]